MTPEEIRDQLVAALRECREYVHDEFCGAADPEAPGDHYEVCQRASAALRLAESQKP